MRGLLAALLLMGAAALCLCSCQYTPDLPEDVHEQSSQGISEPSSLQSDDTSASTDAQPVMRPLPVYNEADIGEISYDPMPVSCIYQAEEGVLSGYAAVSSARSGYSGAGYVSGTSLQDSELVIELKIPAGQHYDLTVCAASDSPVEGVLYVDGLERGIISLSGDGGFEQIKFENIYLAPDMSTVCIKRLNGECDIDFFLLESSDAVYSHDYSVPGMLSNKSSDEAAAKLYKYLCELYGEAVLTAQQCTQGSNAEIEAVATLTGRYPAVRFGDLMGYSSGVDTKDIELAIGYAKSGGLVGYVWNWMQNGSCYAEKSGFSLSSAVTEHDCAHLSRQKLDELHGGGGISDECIALIDGIDAVAVQLKRLSDEGIPVIFRPLPEAANGDFWWSEDIDSYLWLYRLIYTRLTEYHMLGNLIWVWNGQSPDWYVGDEFCDIISLDIYDYSHGSWDNQSHINPMLRMYGVSQSKPIALSECNVLPGPAGIVKDCAYWLYAGVWSGGFAADENGSASLEYMSEAEWIMFYNCSHTLARDEIISIAS